MLKLHDFCNRARVSGLDGRLVQGKVALLGAGVVTGTPTGQGLHGHQTPVWDFMVKEFLVGASIRLFQAEFGTGTEASNNECVVAAEDAVDDGACAGPGQVHVAEVPLATLALEMTVVGENHCRATRGFDGADIEQVLSHDRVTSSQQRAPS